MRSARLALVVVAVLVVCTTIAVAANAKLTVTGLVLAPDGTPASDAQVFVSYAGPDVLERQRPSLSRLTCDAQGRFACEIEVYALELPIQVVVTKPGLAMAWTETTGTEGKPLTLKLGADPVKCIGLIADAEGRHLKGAEAYILWVRRPTLSEGDERPMSLPREVVSSARTDERGIFELGGFPAGTRVTMRATAEGYDYARKDVSVPTDTASLTIGLNPEAVIKGRALRDGKPAAKVQVICSQEATFYDSRGSAISDDNGDFTLRHLSPGAYTVCLDTYRNPEGYVAPPVVGIAVKPGQTHVGADLLLTTGALVTGRATEPDTGRGVADISVYASSLEYPRQTPGVSWSTLTDATGSYSMHVLPGRVQLRCENDGPTFTPRERTVSVAEGQTLELLDFAVAAPPQLKGVVFLPSGQPGAGVVVRAIAWGREAYPQPTTWTDATGAFALTVPEPSGTGVPVLLVAEDLANRLAAAAFVESAADQTMLRLAPGGYALTQVTDEQGKPAARVTISASTVSKGGDAVLAVASSESDEKGMIALGPLPIGLRMWVSVGYKWRDRVVDLGWTYNQDVLLTEGQSLSLPPLRLNLGGRSVEGIVQDQTGKPVAGAVVYGTGSAVAATTDATGHFRMTGLVASAKIWLVAMDAARPLAAATVLDPGRPDAANLTLVPLAAAEGRIVDGNGQPLSTQLMIMPDYPNSVDYNRFEVPYALVARLGARGEYWKTTSNKDGKWSVSNLIAGLKYHPYAMSPEERGMDMPIFDTKPGETSQTGDVTVKPQ